MWRISVEKEKGTWSTGNVWFNREKVCILDYRNIVRRLTKKAGVIRKSKHGVVTRGMVIGDWTVSDETRTMHFETARNISSVWSKLESGMLGLHKVPDES